MQHNESVKVASFDLMLQNANQQEAASLVEALERWLDDGGALDNEAAYTVGARFSPLHFVKS